MSFFAILQSAPLSKLEYYLIVSLHLRQLYDRSAYQLETIQTGSATFHISCSIHGTCHFDHQPWRRKSYTREWKRRKRGRGGASHQRLPDPFRSRRSHFHWRVDDIRPSHTLRSEARRWSQLWSSESLKRRSGLISRVFACGKVPFLAWYSTDVQTPPSQRPRCTWGSVVGPLLTRRIWTCKSHTSNTLTAKTLSWRNYLDPSPGRPTLWVSGCYSW